MALHVDAGTRNIYKDKPLGHKEASAIFRRADVEDKIIHEICRYLRVSEVKPY